MGTTTLEEKLEAITREFVRQIVTTIRSASFAEVAGYVPHGPEAAPKTRVIGKPTVSGSKRPRASEPQTADKRAELGERVMATLRRTGQPMAARALSSELGVDLDSLGAPLRELRAAGRIVKHGEKRATTYSLG